MNTDYESMTVPELRDLAEKRGIELLSDARKAEIIAALEASDLLLHPPAETEQPKSEDAPASPEGKAPPEGKASPEQQENIYEYTTTSTTTALLTPSDFQRIKLSA